jgi:signal transduction histidine kinase/DNA-binding response OmpR family regulator
VDDSLVLAETLTDILSSQEGYQVEYCSDGVSGWDRLVAGAERKALMPDLLLLDLNMPGIDGLTLLRRVRADERFALLPVVILTVEADSETRLRALEAGANDYLPKPVQHLELLARVRALLGWRLAERTERRRMERLIEAGRALLSTLDLDSVLQRVIQTAMAEMDAESTSVWLRGSGDGLTCQAAIGSADQEHPDAKRLLGTRLGPGLGIAGWVLLEQHSALVTDVQSDPRFHRELYEQLNIQPRDVVAVPLSVRKSGIGVLQALNKRSERFSPADLAWMEVLASLAAAAIANAQLFQTLRQRTLQLQARNEELDAFAHTAAHDLKSPLARIVGFAEVLEEKYAELPKDSLQGYLALMAQGGRKMSRIVDELLLLAQVPKMDVQATPLDMASIVSEVTQRLTGMIEERQAELILPTTWPVAMGYGPWVEEIWVNYLSNGIKYGGRPPRVELGAATQSDGTALFWVRDNGNGLTPEAQARLFTPFTRLDQVRAEGHGLGLSIVRRITEKLGGHVSVESKVGQGSVFAFTLPAVSTKTEQQGTAEDTDR